MRIRLGIAGACIALLAALIAIVEVHHLHPVGPDLALHHWFVHHRTSSITTIAKALTYSAQTAAYVVAAVAGIVATAIRRPWWMRALAALAVLVAAQLIRSTLVNAIGRPRPPLVDHAVVAAGYSLPSGHTTTTAVAAGLLVIGVTRSARHRTICVVTSILAIVWAVAVAFTRIYLGVHWPSDVLAGWLLAAGVTLAVDAGLRTRSRL
jgi:undecaprenyl-diphosphatase